MMKYLFPTILGSTIMKRNSFFILSLLCLHGFVVTGLSAQSPNQSSISAWEEKQRKKAEEAERAEIERLGPEVERLAFEGKLDEVENMVETVRYSRVLGEEAKNTWLSRLRVRKVILLGKKANAYLGKGDFERARATIQQAEAEYSRLSEGRRNRSRKVGAVLANTQYQYFKAISAKIEDQIQKNKLRKAEQLYSKATLIYEASTIPDPVRADRSKGLLEAVEVKLRNAQVAETLLRAKAAESKGDIRIARLLYEKAARDGRSSEAKQNLERIEAMRLDPGLNLGLSAIVPGLGQLNSDRALPALGFFFGTALTIGGGLALAISAENRYDQYQEATNPDSAAELYDGINTRWNLGLVLFGTAAALYIWNLVDAYANSVTYNRENF
jgi:hypothetical protein